MTILITYTAYRSGVLTTGHELLTIQPGEMVSTGKVVEQIERGGVTGVVLVNMQVF
jgi:hypothetical protein